MRAIFLDIETTGLDPSIHHPIDIAFKIIDVTRNVEITAYQSVIKQPSTAWAGRDPASIEINGYTPQLIETGKDPSAVAEEIIEIFRGVPIQRGSAVFICQNPSFDRSFFTRLIDVYRQERLNWPYHWLDLASMFWALRVQTYKDQQIPFPEAISLSKNDIAKACGLPPEETPHRALRGVEHLILCYEAVLGVKTQRRP